MPRGNGLAHTDKCRKFREKIQNLELDLVGLQEEKDKMILLNREDKLMIYTGLEMYWKSELSRENQNHSKASKIDKVRNKIANVISGRKNGK